MQATRGTSLSGEPTQQLGGRRLIGVLLVVAAAVVLLDQATKHWAVNALADGHIVHVIDDILQFRLTFNPGAAFSFATGFTFVFTIIAAAVVVVILRISRKLASWRWTIALGLLLGGAVGNLIDRIFRQPSPFEGHVVDFIELPNFPLFNVADSAITCGAVLIVLLSVLGIEIDGSHRRRHQSAGKPDGKDQPDTPSTEP